MIDKRKKDRQKIFVRIDQLIFIMWTGVGLVNLTFFAMHVNPVQLAGIFNGGASDSFIFMAASAFVLLAISGIVLYMAIRKKSTLAKLRRGIIWRVARVFLSAFILFFVAVESVIVAMSFQAKIPETGEIIILGAHVSRSGPSVALYNRVMAGADHALAHPGARVIASGGQGLDEPVTEAEAIRDMLIMRGLDASRIIMEDQSHNTYENLKYSLNLLENTETPYPITIVTNGFHVCRTAMLASRVGLKPYFVAAGTPIYLIPGSYSREFFGLIKSFLLDR